MQNIFQFVQQPFHLWIYYYNDGELEREGKLKLYIYSSGILFKYEFTILKLVIILFKQKKREEMITINIQYCMDKHNYWACVKTNLHNLSSRYLELSTNNNLLFHQAETVIF